MELKVYYREQADRIVEGGLDKVTLNDSHFFRSILDQVDRDELSPIAEYQYAITPISGGVSVAYLGAALLEAKSEALAKEWIGLHLEWRKGIERGQLDQLRERTLEAMESLVTDIQKVLARSVGPL